VQNRWSDAAREVSLAVRKAKAAARKEGAVGSGSGSDSGGQTAGVGAGRRVTMKRGMPEIMPPPPPRGMPFIYPVPPKSEGTPAPGGRMPPGFTPPTGPATQALVEWVNVRTGERWTAPSGGYTPPNEYWVPAAGGTASPVRLPGGARPGGDAAPRRQLRFWREQSRSGVDATPSSRSNGVGSGEGAASTLRLAAKMGRK